MPVEFKDYYRVLGVTAKATDEEIKKAFRTLARKHHPDVAKDKKAAEEKFKEINEANEVLSNPESRRKYDQLGADWKTGGAARPPPGQNGGRSNGRGMRGDEEEFQFEGTGFSDFFEQFFGGRAGGGRGASPFGSYESGNGPAQADQRCVAAGVISSSSFDKIVGSETPPRIESGLCRQLLPQTLFLFADTRRNLNGNSDVKIAALASA